MPMSSLIKRGGRMCLRIIAGFPMTAILSLSSELNTESFLEREVLILSMCSSFTSFLEAVARAATCYTLRESNSCSFACHIPQGSPARSHTVYPNRLPSD